MEINMNGQFLQMIQKLHSLEDFEKTTKQKLKSLESSVWDVAHQRDHPQVPPHIIPSGVIVLFSGQKIPPGWALCDGTNNTPDLSIPSSVENHQQPVYIMKI